MNYADKRKGIIREYIYIQVHIMNKEHMMDEI